MPHVPAEDETTRLKRVYDAYAADDSALARWDPDQPGNRRILAERDALLREAVGEAWAEVATTGRAGTLVDLGCGNGEVLAALVDAHPAATNGVGVDLLESRLRGARAQHPALPLVAGNGLALPLADATVDVMVVFTVFSSILDSTMSRDVASEIARTVKPTGRVIWYDLRRDNPRNPEVRGVSAADISALFPGWTVSLRSCTVLPPLARQAARLTPRSYGWLRRLPPLRSHLFGVLQAPDRPGRH